MKGQLGHEQIFNIIVKIIIPLFIVFGGIFALIWAAHGGLERARMDAMKARVEKDIEDINAQLSEKCVKKDKYWECDTYQTSLIITKIIQSLWINCKNCDCCKDRIPPPINPELTRFFSKNPIKVIKTRCEDYDLREYCPSERIVNEWIITAWGLKLNTELCGMEDFGNKECGRVCKEDEFGKQYYDYSCDDIEGKACILFCDGKDNIKWDAGIITVGEIIEDLAFDWEKGERIRVERELWSTEPACDLFEIGSCKLEICPRAWDKTDNSDVKYGYYEAYENSRAIWICDNPKDCEKNLMFQYSWFTPEKVSSLNKNQIRIDIRAIRKDAKNMLDAGYKLIIKNPNECKLLLCDPLVEHYYACNRRYLDCAEDVTHEMRLPERHEFPRQALSYSAKFTLGYCGDGLCECGESKETCSEDCD
ncbi:MAG: hypothetical protein QXQ40_01130 [Candidatus Aenigmatarchaeota archaeon]